MIALKVCFFRKEALPLRSVFKNHDHAESKNQFKRQKAVLGDRFGQGKTLQSQYLAPPHQQEPQS